MTSMLSILVREEVLDIVIQDPLLVRRHEILPRLSSFKIPVSHPSLHIKRCFYQILPALSLLNLLLLNPESPVHLHGSMIAKHATVIAYQGCRTPVLADRRIEHRNVLLKILSSGHSRGQDRSRIALQNAYAVNHLSTQVVHVKISDVHKPIVMAIC